MKKFDLIIDKYGVGLSVKEGQFYIRHKDARQSIPVSKVRSIALTKSTNITGSAIKLALDNEIDISFIERDGMPFARIWNSKFGSITTIRRHQLAFSQSRDGSLWIKEVIAQKIKNQMGLVFAMAKKTRKQGPFIDRLREKFSKYLLKISTNDDEDALLLANRLRGWEANASKLYFKAMSYFLPKEFQFEKRSKHPALDPFNATLNYCYGILYNKIEGMMIRSGLDPHIGIFHKDQYNRPVLVFDVIELFRHWAEYPVLEAFINKILRKEHFDISKKGVRISSPGRKIVIELFFAYLNEKVEWQDERAKRIVHIKNYIDNFATKMKNYKPNDVKTSGI